MGGIAFAAHEQRVGLVAGLGKQGHDALGHHASNPFSQPDVSQQVRAGAVAGEAQDFFPGSVMGFVVFRQALALYALRT